MSAQIPPVKAVLIGAGNRGRAVYGAWGLKHSDRIQFIAVADPDAVRRNQFADEHGIAEDSRFAAWEDLVAARIPADVCMVCTQDQLHTGPAAAALEAGYHVLLEKPMAVREDECRFLTEKAEAEGKELRICHVLRYTGFFSRIKEVITSGLLGDIININHSENVAFWHFTHSYVRGSWRREDESSPVVLAKTCHDLDILYWMVESRAQSVQSFGSTTHFREDRAPEGAPQRCTDGCPAAESCPFNAVRLYVDAEPLVRITRFSDSPLIRFAGALALRHPRLTAFLGSFYRPLATLADWKAWPMTVLTPDPAKENRLAALKTGPYGRCVYRCDNDVPDHQTVNIEFENGVTATMTMQGLSFLDGRWVRIDGSRGTLIGRMTYAGEKIVFFDHRTSGRKVLWKRGISFEAHGGGDAGLMESFTSAIQGKVFRGETAGSGEALTSARASLESHLMGFAAEQSRKERRVVSMEELRSRTKGLREK